MDIRSIPYTSNCKECGKNIEGYAPSIKYCGRCTKEIDKQRKRKKRKYYEKNPFISYEKLEELDFLTNSLIETLENIYPIKNESKLPKSSSFHEDYIKEVHKKVPFNLSFLRKKHRKAAQTSIIDLKRIRKRFMFNDSLASS